MPSVELSNLQGIGPVRTLPDAERAESVARAADAAAPSQPKPGIALEVGSASQVDLASPPVDRERIDEIRNALRDGTYPLVPTKIADAMIAAQVSFAVLPAGER